MTLLVTAYVLSLYTILACWGGAFGHSGRAQNYHWDPDLDFLYVLGWRAGPLGLHCVFLLDKLRSDVWDLYFELGLGI